ncbi:hypothetical protein GQ43DRAFT_399306 [Delitschia confertaspora ATCC 74209]|uniref:U6 small nuclear RNA (adenine-(43)-N(6))-methyltransferase n=1 Tax=Delitschia confertaspora ATCC 74209 TaxID=1513339 RepID=A0A9P4JH94_9PLEO|nr:hypothetical protein GQ43DRAFT_399306 [Delitschia confertaspora ATCC 74209]
MDPHTGSGIPRTIPYDGPIDFKALARKDSDFAEIYNATKGELDFKNPQTVQQLTKSILKAEFDLKINLPDDRLCPPVPIRWNYAHWIQELIDSTNSNYSDNYDPKRQVVGLDIGTGASAIYAMLLLRTRPNWTMCVTDIDKKSMDSAAANLAINSLLPRTKILQTMPSNSLIPFQALNVEKLDFTMCNPPFFNDVQEMNESLFGTGKKKAPNAVCTGSENEMVYPGGDLAFVTRIYKESLELKEKVTWYSSMFGRFLSMKVFLDRLRADKVENFAVTPLSTGGNTKRWAVAWSFGDFRPRKDLSRTHEVGYKTPLPFPTEYEILLKEEQEPRNVGQAINTLLSSLDITWHYDADKQTGIGFAPKNVWGRHYRREKQRKEKEKVNATEGVKNMDVDVKEQDRKSGEKISKDEEKVGLVFKVRISKSEVLVRWLRGTDTVLWESFCGLLDRSVKSRTST